MYLGRISGNLAPDSRQFAPPHPQLVCRCFEARPPCALQSPPRARIAAGLWHAGSATQASGATRSRPPRCSSGSRRKRRLPSQGSRTPNPATWTRRGGQGERQRGGVNARSAPSSWMRTGTSRPAMAALGPAGLWQLRRVWVRPTRVVVPPRALLALNHRIVLLLPRYSRDIAEI